MELLKSIFTHGSDSAKWSINLRDFLKGLLIAALTAPVTVLLESVNAGQFVFNVDSLLKMAAIGAASYLLKQLVSVKEVKKENSN